MVAAGDTSIRKDEQMDERMNERPKRNSKKKSKSEKNNRAKEMKRLNGPGQT